MTRKLGSSMHSRFELCAIKSAPSSSSSAILWFFAALTLFWPVTAANAHFNLESNLRVIHVEHQSDGLRVFIRLPTPYVVAASAPGEPDRLNEGVAEFVASQDDGSQTLHSLVKGLEPAAEATLARIIAERHELSASGKRLVPDSVHARIYLADQAPAFSTQQEAQASFEARHDPTAVGGAYIGDTVIDAVMFIPTDEGIVEYQFASSLVPGLEGQEDTINLLADHLPGTIRLYQATGTLSTPIEVSRSPFASLSTFVYQGVIHIVEGIDHVLFVICLVFGSATLTGLLWRVTGFTLGHSVTLSLGFFGFVPTGAWFVPAVETGIALSIIYAAAFALFGSSRQSGSEWKWFVITCAIGLLHGLGFSFVLHEILKVDSPNVWQHLLAFNLGVEVGQVLIVLVAWPVSRLLTAHLHSTWIYVRGSVLAGCIAVSLIWTYERAVSTIANL